MTPVKATARNTIRPTRIPKAVVAAGPMAGPLAGCVPVWRFPYTSGYTIGQTPGNPGPTLAAMKTILALVATALLLASPAQAQPQPRIYSQAELDSLLAPVALHPDGLLSQILIAATYP